MLAALLSDAFAPSPIPTPSWEQALACPWSDAELRARLGPIGPSLVFGSPEQVRAGLDRITGPIEADELMVMTILHDHEARLRSYDLLADAYGVERPAA